MMRKTLTILLLIILISQIAASSLPGVDTSEGFSKVSEAEGVSLFRAEHLYGYPAFIQVVRLDLGASLQLLHGPIADAGKGGGVYGGDNPAFQNQTLDAVWRDFSSSNSRAFCLTNGQFFSNPKSPARLPFPLKVAGSILSDGYGLNEFPDQKLMLEIWPDRADIQALTGKALYTSSAPQILAGLSEHASGSRPNKPTGRTFVGVADRDRDGIFETILIFTSKVARKTEASALLRSFGAQKIMMLDGGGSTQLICRGESYIRAGRTIPQTMAVIAAPASLDGGTDPQRMVFVPR
jgi:hypothetical protein